MGSTETVYLEYALLENFFLDGILLYLAVTLSRTKIKWLRLTVASATGAAQAVLFPVLRLPVWAAYLVKFSGGAFLAVLAVSSKRVKPHLIAVGAFFFFTFALGGLLTAVYSFFGIQTEEGGGFYLERAPVALVAGGALCFAIVLTVLCRRLFKFVSLQKRLVDCTLFAGDRQVKWKGLCDSGNLLEFRGQGVCVCSAQAIFALFGRGVKEVGRITMGTASGMRDSPVFACEYLTKAGREKMLLTIGELHSQSYQLILHTSYREGNYEAARSPVRMAR